MLAFEGNILDVGEANHADQLFCFIHNNDVGVRCAGQQLLDVVNGARSREPMNVVGHDVAYFDIANMADLAAFLDAYPARGQQHVEVAASGELAGDKGRDGSRHHHHHGNFIGAGQLEYHQNGGHRRAQHGAGDRAHASNRVYALAGCEVRKNHGGDQSECATQHGADEERGREYAACHAGAEAKCARADFRYE